jgi:hypothetical protein
MGVGGKEDGIGGREYPECGGYAGGGAPYESVGPWGGGGDGPVACDGKVWYGGL